MRFTLYSVLGFAAIGGFFLFFRPHEITIRPQVPEGVTGSPESHPGGISAVLERIPDVVAGPDDLPPQSPLPNPPEAIKALYVSAWVAGTPSRVNAIINLVKRTEINAVVIDVKDYSGYVSYLMDVPEVKEAEADREPRIARPNALLKALHDNGIYAIARITVFQDSVLAKAHPEWALKNSATNKPWVDRKGLAWMDPAGRGTWDYHIAIAKDALARGFDEVNFDYIRFPSDGDLSTALYPFWDQHTSRASTIRKFFAYLREHLPGAKISADLFGLVTVNRDDLGIGQVLEDGYRYFDYVYPMVYPSHYASGFIGYKNPGQHPYEVIKYSLDYARERRSALVRGTTSTPGIPSEQLGKLRPWIQDFDLGAVYTAAMIQQEFQATYDSLRNVSSSDAYAGWAVWDPANTYTEAALGKE